MFPELLRGKLAGICDLSQRQIALLEDHYYLLRHWNQVLNLTAIDDLERAVERHYGESLFLGSYLPAGPLTVADIGSGAGFPGFPVAILRPECRVTLIESHRRKAVFLKEASRNVPNIVVAAKRAEDVEEHFDWIISRAVKYEDIRPEVERLAENAALLTSEPTSIAVPWNPKHFINVFHVKHCDTL